MDPLVALNQIAPDFTLPDLEGRRYRLSQARGRLIVLNFWSAECPWSERGDHELLPALQLWGERVSLWPIASNANEPVELLSQVAAQRGLPRLLLDSDHVVADLYGAVTTPHFFLIDGEGLLRYQGALDDMTFRKRSPTQHYLTPAVEALLLRRLPDPAQTDPYGCAIVRYRL